MGDIVASALVHEGVSGVSSYVSNKLEEKASISHMVARLEMALSQLEFALETTGKLPITYVSLLRRRKVIKQAYIDGTGLLNKHKLLLVEGHKETRQLATSSSFVERVIHVTKLSISSLIGLNKDYLTSSVVQIFEYYADCAAKFVTDVESANPLQNITFRYPLVRHLLEGKTLRYEVIKGSRACLLLVLFPIHQEDRGVEAGLGYTYLDMERPDQCVHLCLFLRLSEDTDVVGITIKCLKLLTSRFKLVTESAIGELTLVPPSTDISQIDAHPRSWFGEKYDNLPKLWRPDPICCTNDVVSSESSLGAPEPVTFIHLEYMLHTSTDGVGRNAPPLYVTAAFAPHAPATQQGFVLKYGAKEEYIGGSIQQMEDILRSKVVDCVLNRPGPMLYYVSWYSAHGVAFMTLGNEQAYPKPTAAAQRRRTMVLEYGGKEEECICGGLQVMEEVGGKPNVFDTVIRQVGLTHYVVKWYYTEHALHCTLYESRNELACPKLSAAPSSSRGAAKRKR